MKQTLWTLLLLSVYASVSYAQAKLDDNDYRSHRNKMYWQNKKPHDAYWQQDVHYKIDASVDERTRIITALEELQYWNNSPHELDFVYFHLYQNAFTKGSYLEELHKVNKQKVRNMGPYQAAGLGTEVMNLKVNGKEVKTELDNTILKVYLPQTLKPGESIRFTMNFKTYFDRGDFRRRMAVYTSWGFPHFNGVHWYPRISVYDAKKGWDTDQHLNKELYGNFGLFDVKLTFAANYIVEATGAIQNEKEVLPDELRKKLDISNFADKPWNEAPSVIIPYDSSKRKTWHYIANNVHDFAFTADPSYRIGETQWNGVRFIAVVTEPHASRWQNAADYVAKIIKTFSEDFGMYEYPKMVAADANDGMEYPMLTLDGGADPDYRGLLVHEIGHNWFYGMLGSNETYRAALDEGFTQFLTSWGLTQIDGETMIERPEKNNYKRKHKEPKLVRDRNVYLRYMNDAMRHEDKQLNTHSDDFHNALAHENGYSNVYHKTATMLYNLQYVLGDSLFLSAMQHYVAKWKMAHPYMEDFRQAIIEHTRQDLNWFFDQWLETTKTADYGIRKIKKTEMKDQYKVTLRRYGLMQMPVDMRVIAKDGRQYDYIIPNTYFAKKTAAKILPRWFGWDLLYPTYTSKVIIPSGIKEVQLDPSFRLADVDMIDNYRRPGQLLPMASTRLQWEHFVSNTPGWRKYQAFIRPDLWWNSIDGVKLGMNLQGNQMNIRRKLYASLWLNTRLGSSLQYRAFEGENWWKGISPVDYTLRYEDLMMRTNPKLAWGIDSRLLDGLFRNALYVRYQLSSSQQLTLSTVGLFRNGRQARNYLLFPDEWSSYLNSGIRSSVPNVYVQAEWQKKYSYDKGFGRLTLTGRSPITYQYAYVQAEQTNSHWLHKLELRTRVFARAGTGSSIANESALYLQGASPEEMMENKWNRSQGVVPAAWGGMATDQFALWHSAGGLNLRAYNGYYAIDQNDSMQQFINYKGRSGASVNVEVDIDQYIKWKPKYLKDYIHGDIYLFGDAGIMSRGVLNANSIPQHNPVAQLGKLRMDAGIGSAWTIKKFGALDKIPPFTFRVDVPLWISAPPFAHPDYFSPRLLLGVGRTF